MKLRLLFALAASLLFTFAMQRAVASLASFAEPAARLGDLVQSFVDADEIVGAELLVVHQGQTIFHKAYGFQDQETRTPMGLNSLFALRSMTKPFVGMAAQILIDEGTLAMDDPVASYLPSFDNESSRRVTLRQLLTHRSGFPLQRPNIDSSTPAASGLFELARAAGVAGPTYPPGERFSYSNVGSDVLGAVIAQVSGQSLELFIEQRILFPMRLTNTITEAEAVSMENRGRVPSRYSGMPHYWTRYWSPSDLPLHPFLKGSGGLFSTVSDYAQFLRLWLDAVSGRRNELISLAAARRALSSESKDVVATGFPYSIGDYGQMWTIYRGSDGTQKLVAFGHGGSDGTRGYALIEQDLIVCYFTQTRGNGTSEKFEEALSHLFLVPDEEGFNELGRLAPPQANEQYLGLYAKGGDPRALSAIVEVNGSLAFEFPGRRLLPLRPTKDADVWTPERLPKDSVTFQRAGGRVTGLAISRGGKVEEAQRFSPAASLPTVEEILSLRATAIPKEAFATLLPLRLVSTLKQNGMEFASVETRDRGGRSLVELDLGTAGSMRVWMQESRVWRQLPGQQIVELQGVERAEESTASLINLLDDWRLPFREITVIAREAYEGRPVYRVRLVPRGGLAVTRLLDAETGDVLAEYAFTLIPGAGLQGVEKHYRSFAEVEGLSLPGEVRFRFPSAPAVDTLLTIREVEVRATVDATTLTPPPAPR